ncbi:MAG: tRNA (cytidine(34)-2'-O)-methyltransferase [Erysipelothrix sp.]|nr:tRNA (cytidine(34)-2'-O)-methyltransferase [Erysipelothrix sp.]
MLHIVLYEPEIPQNTGNIMRTCAALNAKLHLIEPLGFILDEKRVKRAVMDYIDILNYTVHDSFQSFLETVDGELFFLTRYGQKMHSDFDYGQIDKDIYLIFGSESKGIPLEILRQYKEHAFRIPMSHFARSLNLSNAVAICGYEVMRQLEYEGLSKYEVQKGRDHIDKGS